MKFVLAVILWLMAGALAIGSVWFALRGDDRVDFAAITTDGKLQLVVARDRKVVITFSNYAVSGDRRWGLHVDRTQAMWFEFDRRVAERESHVGFAGVRGFAGKRAWGQRVYTDVVEIEFPQWLLALPLLLMIARWYRRVCVRSSRVERGECVACGYDLRGRASDRCPECGVALGPSATRGAQRAGEEIVLAKS